MNSRRRPIHKGRQNRISDARYKDPKNNMLNTESFTHIRKNKKAKKKVSIGKKIRDIKRMIAKIEASETPNMEIIEAQKEKLHNLTKTKRSKRSAKFIDEKYKNIKFYGKNFCE